MPNIFVDGFEELAGLVLGVDVGNGTIAFELDKIQATLIVKGESKDEGIEALRALPKAIQRKIQAKKLGEQVADVCGTATWLWSFCDLKATKAQLEKIHSKRLIKRHLEVPYININAECRTAVKDMKKLAAMLLNLTIKGKSVRTELEAKAQAKTQSIYGNVACVERQMREMYGRNNDIDDNSLADCSALCVWSICIFSWCVSCLIFVGCDTAFDSNTRATLEMYCGI
jgi:hypothetical protein